MASNKPATLVPAPFLLQKLFWSIAFISIIFIGALLLALRSGTKRHPVILGFLVASWITAWIALLPFFGKIGEYSVSKPLIYANVAPGPPRIVCNINAVLLAYMWTVIPGFGLAFIAEVLRMLLEFIRLSNAIDETKPPSRWIRKGSLSSETSESSQEDTSFNNQVSEMPAGYSFRDEWMLEGQACKTNQTLSQRLRKQWSLHWTKDHSRKVFLILPLITAIPSFYLVFEAQARFNWRYVHADYFACYTPDTHNRRLRAIIMLCHLFPASILGVIAVILYFIMRHKTAVGVQRRIHYPLLFRLTAMSILTGIGAGLEWSIDFLLFNRGILNYLPPLYMISFPLIGATIFVDKTIIKQWSSWISFGKK